MMKYLSLFLFLLTTSAAYAQVGSYRNDLAVGFNAGYQLNNISFVPKVPQSMLGGLNFGFTTRYISEKYFNMICGVQLEINYAQSGWKENILSMDDEPCYIADPSNPANGQPQAYQRTINYLQIPLLAHLGFGRESSGGKFFINLGPQFGYCLGESTKTNFAIEDVAKTEPDRVSGVIAQDTMPVHNKFDYGITVGAGLELSVKNIGHFLFEARYYYGLGNIYPDSKADYFARSNHNDIVFKATYLFDVQRTRSKKSKK